MKTTLMALLGLVCLTFMASAADVTGKYTAEVPGRNGTQTNTFTFKVSGDKVEGTVTTQRGDTPITEGKLAGDTLTFVTVLNFNGNEIKATYTGKVNGDSIDFSVDRGRGTPTTFTAKKAQ
jgi:opacity protein-like surface antigen